MFGIVSQLLFPERCVGCKQTGALLCAICRATLKAQPHVNNGTPQTQSMLPYRHAIVKKMLHAWKYKGNRRAETVLIPLFLQGCAQLRFPERCVFVPIPTQRQHDNQRGFAPPHALAHALAMETGHPMQDMLRYTRKTERQASLRLAKRRENMHNAFVVRSDASAMPDSVILVDDVVTSGATLTAAAHALTQHGVRDIQAITLAWNP